MLRKKNTVHGRKAHIALAHDRIRNQDCRLTRTYSPWQAQLRLSYKLQFNSPDISLQQPIVFSPTTLSLSTQDDTNQITLLHDLLQKGYHEQYALVIG